MYMLIFRHFKNSEMIKYKSLVTTTVNIELEF